MRVRTWIAVAVAASAAFGFGCSCAGAPDTPDSGLAPDGGGADGGGRDASVDGGGSGGDANVDAYVMMCGTCGSAQMCCASTGSCVDVDPTTLCDLGVVCDPATITIDTACRATCGTCNDGRGILATYLDVATDGSAIAISGYASGPDGSPPLGDLVVGHAATASDPIHWEVVDGAPTGTGWRGGSTAPGDDVGRWSSLVSLGGDLWVASYDATHGALRVARHDAAGWTSHAVDDVGDAGRYASMAVDSTGRLAIAYVTVARGTGAAASSVLSQVRVARATVPVPAASSDWTFETIEETTIACLPSNCTGIEQCLVTGTCEVPTFDCAPACSAGSACSAGTCVRLAPADAVVADYPLESGWTRLAATATGLALIWHDGRAGREVLRAAAFDGAAWGAAFDVEGSRLGSAYGDCGLGADLIVDSLDRWHVSFVDSTRRRVRYARIESGAVAFRITIDDGALDPTGVTYPEGAHRVGGTTAISRAVDPASSATFVYVAYQDQSAHQLRVARLRDGVVAAPMITLADTMDFAGFWPAMTIAGGTVVVASQWRANATIDRGGTRLSEVH